MRYLKFMLVMFLDILFGAGLSYGLFKYLTKDMGNSTGDMGMGIASVVFSLVAFIVLIFILGFILFSLIM